MVRQDLQDRSSQCRFRCMPSGLILLSLLTIAAPSSSQSIDTTAQGVSSQDLRWKDAMEGRPVDTWRSRVNLISNATQNALPAGGSQGEYLATVSFNISHFHTVEQPLRDGLVDSTGINLNAVGFLRHWLAVGGALTFNGADYFSWDARFIPRVRGVRDARFASLEALAEVGPSGPLGRVFGLVGVAHAGVFVRGGTGIHIGAPETEENATQNSVMKFYGAGAEFYLTRSIGFRAMARRIHIDLSQGPTIGPIDVQIGLVLRVLKD